MGAVLDPWKEVAGYIEGNDYATPYLSRYTQENELPVDIELLRHVNCSHLSTAGRPPTLLALKQHAQSLAVLISLFSPSRDFGEINKAGDAAARKLNELEAYDWLNDLGKPYYTEDRAHHRPLNSLCNMVKASNDRQGTQFHCALEEHPVLPEKRHLDYQKNKYEEERQERPYAGHWNLLMHANECLEMLDHEFSATGGLLSILPTEHELDADQLANAKDSLVGQMILHTQQLTSRMHDLEISYANSLELLGGRTVIPMQNLSTYGPDGRSGRDLVFPQDRWVLANAGEDVHEYIHAALDKVEALDDAADRKDEKQGMVTDALDRAGHGGRRGLVKLDLKTRFYRVKGEARGPIVVLPAFADRADTVRTRQLEERATVVFVPEPQMPERVTDWEKRARGIRESHRKLQTDNAKLLAHAERIREQNTSYQLEAESSRELVRALTASMGAKGDDVSAVKALAEVQARLLAAEERAAKAEKAAERYREERDAIAVGEQSIGKLAATLPRDPDGQLSTSVIRTFVETVKQARDENKELRLELRRLKKKPAAASKPGGGGGSGGDGGGIPSAPTSGPWAYGTVPDPDNMAVDGATFKPEA